MVEVLAEALLLYLLTQVLVGGRNHPHVHIYVLVAADAREFLLLKHAQHLGLGRKGHIAYLIEEKGSAVGLLELALVLLDRRGERALLMTEKLALDKLRRNGGAVHFDIWGA